MRVLSAVIVVLFAASLAAAADEKLPVEVRLIANKTSYKLDLGGKTAAEFKELLAKAGKSGGILPTPPAVDLQFEVVNTSDKAIQIWHKGDPVRLVLDVTGPDAMRVHSNRPMTLEFRLPVPMTLEPGKSLQIPITSLTFGHRGVSEMAYWMKAGEYSIVANFHTAISPAPKGSKPAEQGFGTLVLKSAEVKVKVTE
jgi:hypothetical protein